MGKCLNLNYILQSLISAYTFLETQAHFTADTCDIFVSISDHSRPLKLILFKFSYTLAIDCRWGSQANVKKKKFNPKKNMTLFSNFIF